MNGKNDWMKALHPMIGMMLNFQIKQILGQSNIAFFKRTIIPTFVTNNLRSC